MVQSSDSTPRKKKEIFDIVGKKGQCFLTADFRPDGRLLTIGEKNGDIHTYDYAS